MLRRCTASLGFLLKDVQDIDDARELDRVHRPVGIAVEVSTTSSTPAPPKPLSGFADGCFSPIWAIKIAYVSIGLTS